MIVAYQPRLGDTCGICRARPVVARRIEAGWEINLCDPCLGDALAADGGDLSALEIQQGERPGARFFSFADRRRSIICF